MSYEPTFNSSSPQGAAISRHHSIIEPHHINPKHQHNAAKITNIHNAAYAPGMAAAMGGANYGGGTVEASRGGGGMTGMNPNSHIRIRTDLHGDPSSLAEIELKQRAQAEQMMALSEQIERKRRVKEAEKAKNLEEVYYIEYCFI